MHVKGTKVDNDKSLKITLDNINDMATTIDGSYYVADTTIIGTTGSPYIHDTVDTSSISWVSDSDRIIGLEKSVDEIKRRLCILEPNFALHEQFPMLKELYDQYRALEKILSTPDTDED
jgi:hypothetical protein